MGTVVEGLPSESNESVFIVSITSIAGLSLYLLQISDGKPEDLLRFVLTNHRQVGYKILGLDEAPKCNKRDAKIPVNQD